MASLRFNRMIRNPFPAFLLISVFLTGYPARSNPVANDTVTVSSQDSLQAKNWYEEARLLRKEGNYEAALSLLNKTRSFCELRQLWKPLALTYWEEAYILWNAADPDIALRPLFLLDSIARQHQDSVLVAESLKMKGNLMYGMGRYDQALTFHREALDWGNPSQDGHTYNELARDHFALGAIDSATLFLNRSIAQKAELGDFYGLAVTYGNAGHLYSSLEQEHTAQAFFDSCMTIAAQNRFYDLQAWMYKSLSDILAGDHDFEKALGYYRLFVRYQDSARIQAQGMDFVMEKIKTTSAWQQQQMIRQQSELDRTTLFLYLFIFLFVLAISILLIVRLYMKKRQAELRQKLSRLQMNPHFIFNSLNSLQTFILDNDIRESNKFLTRFSALMRSTLENSYQDMVTLQAELDHLNLYLELESMRFNRKFSYQVDVDEAVSPSDMKIPSLLIQPFVENAIWHGLLNKKTDDRKLNIRLYIRDKHLICEVEDNGIGRAEAMAIRSRSQNRKTSLGTTITEQRLSLLHMIYKRKFNVIYHDLQDALGNATGTRVDIRIPATL